MANLKIIKELCTEKGLSLEDLATKSGLGLRAIQKIIHDNSTKIETLERIAQALQVRVSIFFPDPPSGGDKIKEIEKVLLGIPKDLESVKIVFEILKEKKEIYRRYTELLFKNFLFERIFMLFIETHLMPKISDIKSPKEQLKFAESLVGYFYDYIKVHADEFNEITNDIPESIVDQSLSPFVVNQRNEEIMKIFKERESSVLGKNLNNLLQDNVLNRLFIEASSFLDPGLKELFVENSKNQE